MIPIRPSTTSLLVTLFIGLLTAGGSAWAQTPEEKGLSIATEADRRGDGFGDFSQTLAMTLRAKNGQEAVRELRFKVLEFQGDGDRSLIIFDQPKDVEGTALLTYAHKTGDDDIWLFLPALKRVKRIAGSNKSGPFMGSEFAFEDISSAEPEKYRYRYLREERLNDRECHVVEAVPAYSNSGYSRMEIWFDKAELRTERTVFFDKRGELLKTQTSTGFQKYLDKYWYPDRVEMVNHQNGRSTTLLNKDYRFRNGLTPRDFDQASLEGVR